MRPSLDRIDRAAESLANVQLGRGASNLIRWLAVKWAGGRPGGMPTVLTGATVTDFCNLFFAVPGQDPYRWYDPFTAGWSKMSANGGWPIGSVLTQIKRPGGTLKALLNTSDSAAGRRGAVQVELPSVDRYLHVLSNIIANVDRVPMRDLAIWRYRFGIPAELGANITEVALADALVVELNLSGEERLAIFEDADQPAQDGEDASWLAEEDWEDATLAQILVAPLPPTPVEVTAPEPPRDDPHADDGGYEELRPYTGLPLESADIDALIGRVETAANDRGLLLPDSELVEQCVLALLTGHIVLQGPPGTGKTTLARALAEAFDCSSELQTATADWSTYDVIGGLQPSIGADEREVLRPWLGHVPRAALRCARIAREHEQSPAGQPQQAHWLIIDEFSRAQVDKAIGGLYTMLGGSGEQSLELWFENDPLRKVVPIPSRFRIIATMNDVDASFVYDFSQGLSRRFQFIYVGVPRREDLGDEIQAALAHAAVWLAAQYPELAGTRNSVDLYERWYADARIEPVLQLLEDVVAHVRYPESGAAGGGWPLGTAQLGDVLRRVVLREAGVADLIPVLDLALADRIVPQLNGAKPVVVQELIGWLGQEHAANLARTIRAAKHLRDTSATT